MKKLAIIEMDIRFCRMLIVEYTDKPLINIVSDVTEPIDIWRDVEADNVIKPARTQELVAILNAVINAVSFVLIFIFQPHFL